MDNETFALNYTQAAREDMLDILMYISDELHSPRAAERILEKIEKDLERLREHPYSAPIARDTYLSSQGFRMLVTGKYLVFYKVNESFSEVLVYRIVYGKRNVEWLMP